MRAKKRKAFLNGAHGLIRGRICLTALMILFGGISVANAQSSAAPQSASSTGTSGWTWIQDSPLIFCQGANRTGCSPGSGNIVPTVAGSVWVLQSQSPNNVTITSVTGGGGTWIHCPNCHVTNPAGLTADTWYNLTGNAGFDGTTLTFNLSGNAGSFFTANFYELLPPPGSTASFDTSGTATPTNCTTCTGVNLGTLAGTDAIISNPGGGPQAAWNSWSAPYITDYNGGSVCLNCTSGAAPTVTFHTPPLQNPEFMAIAFTSTAGTFTPPPKQYTLVNFTALAPGNCNSCTLNIPATTGAGHLLFVEAADESGTTISSVSGGGGTWTAPSGCSLRQTVQSQNNTASCAYNLSVAQGTASIVVTMSGSAATNFAVFEVATASGTFAFDTIGGTLNTAATGYYFPGQPLTLTGGNDVIFQLAWDVGGSLGPNYYAQPYIYNATGSTLGPLNYFLLNEAAVVVLTDSGPSPPTPTWINAVPNQNTFVTAVAFTAH